jgi:formimidoylglutamate deiminase
MTSKSYHFRHALLPSGWARDVRVDVADGAIAQVTPDAPREGTSVAGLAIPGLPNLHCHSFQSGVARQMTASGPGAR